MRRLTQGHAFSNRNLVIGSIILLTMGGCGYGGARLTVQELKDVVDSADREIVVIDVRPRSQFEKGHVPGAINFPLEEIEKKKESIVSMKGEVAIICTCGKRSLAAVKQLADSGITTTFVEGGMKKWEAAGYGKIKGK